MSLIGDDGEVVPATDAANNIQSPTSVTPPGDDNLDESYRVSFSSNVPADFTRRTLEILNTRHDDSQLQLYVKDKSTRKYKPVLPRAVQLSIAPRKKQMEFQSRLYYLLHLNANGAEALVSHFFNDITGTGSSNVRDWARDRVYSNVRNWKKRLRDNLRDHVKEVMADNPHLRLEDRISRLHMHFEGTFTPETFVTVFDFCHNHIDVENSTAKVKEWAELLYVELCSSVKRHLDWKEDPEAKLRSEVDDTWLSERLTNICESQCYASMRPDAEEIKPVTKSRKSKKRKADQRPAPDLDNDDTLYRGKRRN